MTASPALGGAEIRELRRPTGMRLSVLIRDKCAPPHPTPPVPVPGRTGRPLSHGRTGRGRYLRGSLPTELRLRRWGSQGSAGPRCVLPPSGAQSSPSGHCPRGALISDAEQLWVGGKHLAPALILRLAQFPLQLGQAHGGRPPGCRDASGQMGRVWAVACGGKGQR